MRRTSCFVILALATGCVGIGASGCHPSPAVTVVRLGPGERAEPVRGDAVKTRRGGQEAYVGLRGGYYVVRSIEDWRKAWPSGGESPYPSTLDPRSMLLLTVAEDKESVGLRITKVLETGDRIHVWVKETRAGESCPAKREHVPFDSVVAPRIDKPVRFYVEEERAEACGEAPEVTVNCRAGNAPKWSSSVVAQPGDEIDCEMRASSRGKFAIVDSMLSLGELPGGSTTKLAYTKVASRGKFAIDVFGTYTVRAEAADEGGRRSIATARIDASPPRTKDVVVQLVWNNLDVNDDPDTFPRLKLRAFEDRTDAKNKPVHDECSQDAPRPELCAVKTRSAYTQMRLVASDKRIPLDVLYVDERAEKGPLACLQIYFDGKRTGETCDRKIRLAGDRWQAGIVDMQTGKLVDPATPATATVADAGAEAGSGTADGGGIGIKPLPPRIPAPKPGPPTPPAPLAPQLAPRK
jgi:hypothetical protein